MEEKKQVILGIDPGMTGAIAVLGDGLLPLVFDMPGTERDTFDLLAGLERGVAPYAFIEQVGPMPKQGISSTWKFSGSYHGLRMALIALRIPFIAVPPGTWMKKLHCLNKGDKRITQRRAQELFPQVHRVTQSRADSLLIAAYGYMTQFGRPFNG